MWISRAGFEGLKLLTFAQIALLLRLVGSMKYLIICCGLLLGCLSLSQAQMPCTNGFAGGFACDHTDLYAHLDTSAANGIGAVKWAQFAGNKLSDLWGWTDSQTGKEYVILGRWAGTTFIDVSDPVNPVVLGNLPSHSFDSVFVRPQRDIKVFFDHAFIVADIPAHGMQVFDLTQLRNVTNPPVTFSESAHYSGFGRAHNLALNETTGYAYPVAVNDSIPPFCRFGMHFINVTNPQQPFLQGCTRPPNTPYYVHDAQCVTYHGPDPNFIGHELCFLSSGPRINVVDVTDKVNPDFVVASFPYPGVAYAHQGWLTEDHRYFVVDDEFDEINNTNGTVNTRTHFIDFQQVDNPEYIGFYESPTDSSVDHNLFIRDGFIFQANYRSGFHVLDTTGISMTPPGGQVPIQEVAYLDTDPDTGGVEQSLAEGAWGVYPFFESGLVAVSDINQGLFLLNPILDSLYFVGGVDTVEGCQDDTVEMVVDVRSQRGNPMELQWQMDSGGGFVDLANVSGFSQVNGPRLKVTVDVALFGNRFRCRVAAKQARSVISGEQVMVEQVGCGMSNGTGLGQEVRLRIFPNPAHNALNCEIEGVSTPLNAELIQINGTVVAQGKTHTYHGVQRIHFEVHDLPRGVYGVKLYSEKGMEVRRVILN